MSFSCDHCGFKNNEVQPAGQIQEQGIKYTFKIKHPGDLERQIVKSDTAILRIETIDLEIPPGRGRLTNVEGVLTEVLQNLKESQLARKIQDPEAFEKVDVIVQALSKTLNMPAKYSCNITLDDPAGNSWIEPSPTADPSSKENYVRKQYPRTPEQNSLLGLGDPQHGDESASLGEKAVEQQPDDAWGVTDSEIVEGRAYDLPIPCPGCTAPAQIQMRMVNIPHFKQVVIQSVHCNQCGYRTNDVKTGGEIPEKGQRIWLDVKTAEDLSRDILKSENCLLRVPDINLEVQPGSMGARFTTVEGLITQVRDDLKASIFDIGEDDSIPSTDSMPEATRNTWVAFFAQIDKALKAEVEFTMVMEDPLAGSYCQTRGDPSTDPQVRIEDYERTEAEEEELGLADMKTHLNENGEYVREPSREGVNEIEAKTD